MNRRGFIRSVAGLMASVVAGKAPVPMAPVVLRIPLAGPPSAFVIFQPFPGMEHTPMGRYYIKQELMAKHTGVRA